MDGQRGSGHKAGDPGGRGAEDGGAGGPGGGAFSDGGPVSHAIFRLARLHRQLAGQLLRRAGLRPGQEQLMMHLWETGRQRQTELIAVLGSDSATMTRAVQRLEKAGFVRRVPCATDRRVVMVEPTPAGLALRERVEELWRELEELTTRGYDPRQAAASLRVLEDLEHNVARALGPAQTTATTARPEPPSMPE